ncbi:FAD-binding oxidoreductase [Aspergillus novofumigatus IBT 16806]|uniref:FAD-binding domain-containing protein n=1 Tax=Aspergillus novofumigatus (strain IBT 16806) TaxID=1392255 RepID=A0A2I1BSK9_ASPN1|nr:FAD-binding domain-containing protein [Aspergillus novofumigatus IBT 16806]PKX88378.1 FAD-binding domain-containing protein [Aspergillus novofumigatus IBT 16806]
MIDREKPVQDCLRHLMPSLSIYTEGRHYQDCLELYNHALSKQPLVCARPRTEQEVSHLVQLCTEESVPFAVRSGGHDFFGRSLVHKGVLIDMRAMDSVRVEPDQASARVGGGVIAGPLQETLNSHGLFTPTGQAKSVGYVSWACGGGYGFYVGTYGFEVDQILGARVVLARGHVVDTDEDPELLWALRGAGAGIFGIVTELRVKVYPVPKLYAGFLAFPLAEAATQMMQAGRVLGNTVTETIPAAYGLGDSSSGMFFRSRNVDRIHQKVGAILALHPPPHPLSAVIFHNNHGKGIRHEVEDNVGAAFPNRHQHVILGLHGGTRPGQVDAQELADATRWVTELEEAIDQTGLSLQGGFPAFWPPDQVDGAARLQRLKARLDQNDLFHHALPGLKAG